MYLLEELSQKYKRISIVGMAKNAGKTTALNYLIEEAMDEGLTLGITSTGRDGEGTDVVTGTDKPRVFLDTDTIVSVPTQLYELADAGLEILKMTDYGSSLGQIMLCRVASSGYVQVAGPVINANHIELCEEMLALGAQMVLIDGAIDRKSIAAPGTSDAIILSTGAVLSRKMAKVVEETAYTVTLYRLPVLESGQERELIEEHAVNDQIILIRDGKPVLLDVTTGLGAGSILDSEIDDLTTHVFVPGAFTASAVADINPKKLKNVTFVLKDPTKIFIGSTLWGQLRKRGLKVEVLENIKVAAITVNPTAPAGYRFDHRELVDAMQKAIPDIPVIDVML
ncbi:MAG: hypothetical protein MJ161_04930 [Clostridia bacterium]|nr:hypothetical protein [Clostridia bacterium]